MAKPSPIPLADLRKTAEARLADARSLCDSGRYDGAIYLCGYAVEMALKVRLCKHLKWPEFLPAGLDDQLYRSIMTHKFDTLLSLSGREEKLKNSSLWVHWNTVATWEPDMRYKLGNATKAQAEDMIDAARELVKFLCSR